ncbi:MAG: hypothetical protein VW831_11130, partial [Gammaproteobacteria bacterium]
MGTYRPSATGSASLAYAVTAPTELALNSILFAAGVVGVVFRSNYRHNMKKLVVIVMVLATLTQA